MERNNMNNETINKTLNDSQDVRFTKKTIRPIVITALITLIISAAISSAVTILVSRNLSLGDKETSAESDVSSQSVDSNSEFSQDGADEQDDVVCNTVIDPDSGAPEYAIIREKNSSSRQEFIVDILTTSFYESDRQYSSYDVTFPKNVLSYSYANAGNGSGREAAYFVLEDGTLYFISVSETIQNNKVTLRQVETISNATSIINAFSKCNTAGSGSVAVVVIRDGSIHELGDDDIDWDSFIDY